MKINEIKKHIVKNNLTITMARKANFYNQENVYEKIEFLPNEFDKFLEIVSKIANSRSNWICQFTEIKSLGEENELQDYYDFRTNDCNFNGKLESFITDFVSLGYNFDLKKLVYHNDSEIILKNRYPDVNLRFIKKQDGIKEEQGLIFREKISKNWFLRTLNGDWISHRDNINQNQITTNEKIASEIAFIQWKVKETKRAIEHNLQAIKYTLSEKGFDCAIINDFHGIIEEMFDKEPLSIFDKTTNQLTKW